MILKQAIQKLIHAEDLTADEINSIFAEILSAENETQIAAFLMLLRAKGESATEISTLVSCMREQMQTVTCPHPLLDIVGTGGDGFNTINISTGSALLAASCGVKVAKHGNRSVSSLCGSADVLESLGLNIDLDGSAVANCITQTNFGFCFAPNFHSALGKLKHIRKQLALPTVFNLLGPLLNPAQADYLMVGVADSAYLSTFAEVLCQLNTKRAVVFHCAGLDEMCCVAPIDIIEISTGSQRQFSLDPTQYGFNRCSVDDLRGGTPKENAALLTRILQGEPGPIAESLVLNAGYACMLCGLADKLSDGVALAREAHKKGAAYQLLTQLRELTQQISEKHHA